MNLADVCHSKGIPVTIFATGCIYTYDEAHPIRSNQGFTEDDEPNFHGSFYSHTKVIVESLLKLYDNVLILRARLPISDDWSARNLVSKLTTFEKVVDIPNSMSVLPDLLPYAIELTERNIRGVLNFTNPGTISHNGILALYRDIVDPSFTWQNFTEEEQNKILLAARANNHLDTSKLQTLCPGVKDVHTAVSDVMKRLQLPNPNKKQKIK